MDGSPARRIGWLRALGFAAVVYGAPLLLGSVAATALDREAGVSPSLVPLAAAVAVVGMVVLAVVVRRLRAPDAPALGLAAAASGFAASALAGLLLPVTGVVASGGGFGGAATYGMLGLAAGPLVYLLAAGPLWLVASALCFASILLPARIAVARGRRAGAVLTALGAVGAVLVIALAVGDAGGGSPTERCARSDTGTSLRDDLATGVAAGAYTPRGSLSWFPLGLRCEWRLPDGPRIHEPGWLATICVVWALALLALGVAMLVRSRTRRPLPAAGALGGPEDPWSRV